MAGVFEALSYIPFVGTALQVGVMGYNTFKNCYDQETGMKLDKECGVNFAKETGKVAMSAAMDLTGFGIIAKAVSKGVSFGLIDNAEEIINTVK